MGVTFINSCCEPDTTLTDHDMVRSSFGAAYEPPAPACTGPCHGLSPNSLWADPCANCPFRKEFSIHG